MLPPSVAFAWVLWRQHGRGFFMVLAYLFFAAILSAVLESWCAPGTAVGALGLLLCLALPALPIYLLGVFAYGFEGADVVARESCFPARLYRLPVSTHSLVVWPMVYGTAAAVGLWLLVAGVLLRPWLQAINGEVALWWPGLLMAAALAWVQALLWSPFGLRWLRVILLSSLIVGLVPVACFSAASGLSEALLVSAYAGLTVVAWMVAYVGVRHGRRGDTPDWEALLRPLYPIARWWPQRRSSFVSATRAQVWYEWRLNGWSLPFSTGLLLIVVLWLLSFGDNEVLPTEQTLLSSLAIPVFLGGLFGARGGGNDGVKGRIGLGSFSATLPLSTTDMVAAMLKVAALSSLAAWGVMAVALPLAVAVTGNLDVVAAWWRQAMPEHHPIRIAAGIAALATLLFVATWRRQVDRLYFGLTGQAWIARSAIMFFTGSIFLCFLAYWLYHRPDTHETFLAVLPWLLGPLVLCRLLATMWALREVLRRGLLQQRTAARWVAAWLLLASMLFVVLAWAVPTEQVPVYYLAFGVLFAMPMVRLAATPLALAWNRHR